MANIKRIVKELKVDPISKLVEKAPIHVRYVVVKRYLKDETELLTELIKKQAEDPVRKKILQTQQEDGKWQLDKDYKIEEKQKAIQFFLQLRNMCHLYELNCPIGMDNVKKGIIALLKFQKPDGKFPLLQHHHGMALWLLGLYGLSGNPFVEKGYRWITKRQRDDGGWLSSTMLPKGESPKKSKSCIWTTVMIFQAIANHSRLKSTSTCQKAADFVLKNYLIQNKTSLFPEPNAWDYLYHNYSENGIFRGGTLRYLDALASLPEVYKEKNFRKALDWILSMQLPSGLFPAIAGKSKDGDYMVTFQVLKVLEKIINNRY